MKRAPSNSMLVVTLACLLGACSDVGTKPLTELVVVIDTDLRRPDQIDRLDVEMRGPNRPMPLREGTALDCSAGELPLTFSLTPGGDREGDIRIDIRGFRGADAVIERVVVTRFVPNERRVLPIVLREACLDGVREVTCGSGRTCAGIGECIDPFVDASELAPLDAGIPASELAPCPRDGGMDAALPAEICNGRDDDGDSIVDEGFDLSTDVFNCGECGNSCDQPGLSSFSCDDGTCNAGDCLPGFVDCNGRADGCEDLATDLEHCSRCFYSCDTLDRGGDCRAGICVDERVTRLAAGDSFTCEVHSNGILRCFGDGAPVDTQPRVTTACAGRGYVCAIVEDVADGGAGAHRLRCWGTVGSPPADLEPLDVACGKSHACAIGRTGSGADAGVAGLQVSCWGQDTNGKLGGGNPVDVTVVDAGGRFDRPLSIGAGGEHSCAVVATMDETSDARRVVCWGDNTNDQLGLRADCTADTCGPGAAGGWLTTDPDGVHALALGDAHTCVTALTAGIEEVRCWGEARGHRLGSDLGGSTPNPQRVDLGGAVPLAAPNAVSAGAQHTCVAVEGGQVRCWGTDVQGQAGGGSRACGSGLATTAPVAIRTPSGMLGGVDAVVAGTEHTCAWRAGDPGPWYCWGWNRAGQLGRLTTPDDCDAIARPIPWPP